MKGILDTLQREDQSQSSHKSNDKGKAQETQQSCAIPHTTYQHCFRSIGEWIDVWSNTFLPASTNLRRERETSSKLFHTEQRQSYGKCTKHHNKTGTFTGRITVTSQDDFHNHSLLLKDIHSIEPKLEEIS